MAICTRIGYEFYCEELFVVRHKSIHSCKSAIYFNLDTEIIKKNCDFVFYFNKSDITSTVLDGGNEIILANWPDNKCIICTINNDFPIAIPRHPYVLVNRSILCNCRIEAENNFLLESLAACHDTNTKLKMYFTVNNAFTNYLNEFNLAGEVEIPIFTNKSTLEITLPVSLNKSTFGKTLLSAPLTLKEYVTQYKHDKEIFAYGYFSFCLISCIKDILKNRTYNFSVETSLCQFSNMASSGLKKMLILQYYIHKKCIRKYFPKNTFFYFS